GEINRQTVSVAVDQQAAAAVDPATLTDLVASAAGVNEERGDVVTVEVIPFSTLDADAAAEALAEAEAAAAAAAEAEQMRNLAIIAAVVVLALILAIVTAARRRRRTRAEALDVREANTVV